MKNRSIAWLGAAALTAGVVWQHHKPSAPPDLNDDTVKRSTAAEARQEPIPPAVMKSSIAERPTSAPAAGPMAPPETKKKLSPAEIKKQMDTFASRFEQFNRCYSENCVPAGVHPRTAVYEAGQNIKLELMVLKSFVDENSLTDTRVTDIALRALENEDGHVQTVALELLASQPAATENMEAILDKVVRGSDAEMIGQAFQELQRYSSSVEQEKIQQTLAEELVTGSPFVSEAIAEKIQPFLNPKSISVFESVLEKIGPGSKIYDHLQTSIQQFHQQHG